MPNLPSFPPIPDGSDDTQRIGGESMGGEDSQQEEQARLLEKILEELRDLNQKIDDLPAAIAQLADQGGLGEDI